MEMKNDDGQHVDLGSSRNPDDSGKESRGRRSPAASDCPFGLFRSKCTKAEAGSSISHPPFHVERRLRPRRDESIFSSVCSQKSR